MISSFSEGRGSWANMIKFYVEVAVIDVMQVVIQREIQDSN